MIPLKPCGLLRRFAAISYDLLLLAALDFIATAILLIFTSGVAVDSSNTFFKLYLLLIAWLYFAWQWTHGGQTLGMRAWKIRLYTADNGPVSWPVATKRYLFALLSWLFAGAGFLWALFDRNKLTFHDRYSKSRLLLVPREPKPSRSGRSVPQQIQY
jgi:uncharacterized RDD family membrane protein YckC